jgi:hypothetical protein
MQNTVEMRSVNTSDFLAALRGRFYRGHDEAVDFVVDSIMAPLVAEILAGRIESAEVAGAIAGEQLRASFSPPKRR